MTSADFRWPSTLDELIALQRALARATPFASVRQLDGGRPTR